MVSNALSETLLYATPALASLAVAGSAWWTAPRGTAISAWRVAGTRWIPAALVALISGALGVLAYAGHAPAVSRSQALDGAVIALLASALPLSMYWAAGRVVRRLPFLVVGWIASLMPLYFYAFLALVIVAGHTQCGPDASECPL